MTRAHCNALRLIFTVHHYHRVVAAVVVLARLSLSLFLSRAHAHTRGILSSLPIEGEGERVEKRDEIWYLNAT